LTPLEESEALQVATAMLGADAELCHVETCGRNSRVWRVKTSDGAFALKKYPPRGEGARDRLASEVSALQLMAHCGIHTVPRLIDYDGERGYALLSWIEGTAVHSIDAEDIAAAVEFLSAIYELRRRPCALRLPLAAEACLSGAEIKHQILKRIQRLHDTAGGDTRLIEFLEGSFAFVLPAWSALAEHRLAAARLDFNADLAAESRSLVPSDFGFHNSLRRNDGSLAFVDFEYFGWDDPVKLTSDILLHPGSPLAPGQRIRFREAAERLYGADPTFKVRLAAYLPLFGLRWVLILLNEFVPERWRGRLLAGETGSWDAVKLRQLSRARDFLTALRAEFGE